MAGPSADEVADRALVLYALARRAAIELTLEGFEYHPERIQQAEVARSETQRWLARESLTQALTDTERTLLGAAAGAWPREAVIDGLWRKESFGVLLWALQHIPALPGIDEEFEVEVLDARIAAYGSVSAFRANGLLRPEGEIERARQEADAWLAATEGRDGQDATLASISAERVRALSWLRDRDAAPA